MAFSTSVLIDKGGSTPNGTFSKKVRIAATFTADASGNGGSITIPDVSGVSIYGVATTGSMIVAMVDIDGVDLMGSLSGIALNSRYTYSVPVPVVGGVTLTVTSAPVSATNKVILYVE